MTTDQVKCPVCGRSARVNLDGKLRKHKSRLSTPRRYGSWCPNTSPHGRLKAAGAANGGRLPTPAESGTVPSSDGSKLPSRPTFKGRVLSNPAARVAHEDAESRNFLIDMLIGMRRTKGLTQVQIAEQMAVNQSTVSGFETESSDPHLSTVQRYARAVGAELILELRSHEPEGQVGHVAGDASGLD